MKRILISGVLLAFLFASEGCKDKQESKVLTREVVFTKEGEVSLKKAANDSLLAQFNIEIADDAYQIETGLMYRTSMNDDQGMLFFLNEERIQSFYMKNTEIPLDIIFINSDKKVVNIHKNAKPFDQTSLFSEGPAIYVLEVNAGLTDLWELQPGDKVDWNH
ncbi:DUF192 domain-containing protein [Ulvibacter antarcticus]|uniref:DUF192 domain-containing protein n=1 Tax=Ulvibacter antarcticus TaxID=442714 RepID=A0A3L9YRB2_9FLAO|nr:DUF192 domain-containing protein [Ulvibacter antarcticus]RMA57022.1 hypothetical protein BXY75_2903 [Ulvibacter antarcticus]